MTSQCIYLCSMAASVRIVKRNTLTSHGFPDIKPQTFGGHGLDRLEHSIYNLVGGFGLSVALLVARRTNNRKVVGSICLYANVVCKTTDR